MTDKHTKKRLRTIDMQINRALRLHKLIEDGDKILVGLSGGVDSMVLLHALAMRRKYWADFKLSAMHVNLVNLPYQADRDYLQQFCDRLEVPLFWHEQSIVIEKDKGGKTPCFICSWNRRRILFKQAEALAYNKLALGHHRDDAIETFLMNMIYRGTLSSLPEKLRMFDGKLFLIRPILYLTKNDIEFYARHYDIRTSVKTCSFAGQTARRREISRIMNQMQQIHPRALDNVFRSMGRRFDEYLPDYD